ncbi:MAG: M3 family oligoendopeptidase [Myxococcales bacterium]|nr:M3 family oligoendopeptidase [Myxococcales bacterium]
MNAAAEALRWDLSDLYASTDDPGIARDTNAALAEAEALAARHRGKVATLDAPSLADLLRAFEALLARAYRPSAYASLLFSANTSDPAGQALLDQAREALAHVSTTVKFLDVELKTAPDAIFDAWASAPALAGYRHFLRATRRYAPHTLSEAEENLATLKSLSGAAAWNQLYDETVSAIRVPLTVEGEARDLTVDEARALRGSPDRDLRARATRAIHQAHAGQSHVLNFVFNTLFQDHKIELGLRRYESPIAPTLLDDELTPAIAESLMATTEKNYCLAQEYYRLKARALDLPDFASHDLLAPLPGGDRTIPFDEARTLVLDSFRAFSPRIAEIAERHFDRRWIDVMPRQNKRGGAFCAAWLPDLHPYVLTNYNERFQDVSTVAHELGHAVHFVLAGERQTLLNYGPTTPMAETASVFGEIVLARRLLEQERDPAARRSLLAQRIEDIIATVYRQVMYTRWEQEAHARRAEGVVTVEGFGALWRAQTERLYGDAVKLGELDHWGFIGIPHFIHSRFYCYSYAYGQLLVLALYRRYLEEGEAFVPRYLELLAGGGSGTPEELLRGVGIDLHAPGFWQLGFDTLRDLVDQFRATVS